MANPFAIIIDDAIFWAQEEKSVDAPIEVFVSCVRV